MRILITGGAGFVGGNLGVHLSQCGHTVIALDNLVRRGSEYNLSRLWNHGIEFRHGDVRCPEDWRDIKADVVLECSAQPSAIDGYQNPVFDFTNNTVPLIHLLDWCRQRQAGIILWSTNKVYPVHAVHNQRIIETPERYVSEKAIDENTPLDGGDRSLYGASKVMADLMVQEWSDAFKIPAIVNRFSCLAGPWQWGKCEQGWVAWWMIAHRLGLPLKYIGFQGKQVRDVLFVDDLCRLIEMQIEKMPIGKVYNVGGGKYNSISLRECTHFCQQITGRKVPISIMEEPRRADFAVYISDTAKVEKDYGWFPTVFNEEGLEQIDEWAVGHLPLLSNLFEISASYGTTKLAIENRR